MVRWIVWTLILFVCVPHVFAARSLSITGNTSSLLGDDILTLTASPSGFTDGEVIYLKGAFFQNGTSNYFGLTKNENSWVKNSASNASQRQVKIGEWDGTLLLRADFSDSGYKGEGEYPVKIRYYYGSSMTADWSVNSLLINISEPDPTMTPTPNPTSIPTSTQPPTSVPSPTLTPVRATFEPTSSVISLKPTLPNIVISATTSDVLGISEAVTDSKHASISQSVSIASMSGSAMGLRPLSIALSFVASGFALLSVVTLWHNIDIWKVHVLKRRS